MISPSRWRRACIDILATEHLDAKLAAVHALHAAVAATPPNAAVGDWDAEQLTLPPSPAPLFDGPRLHHARDFNKSGAKRTSAAKHARDGATTDSATTQSATPPPPHAAVPVLHAIAHIEMNAINMYVDTAVRFTGVDLLESGLLRVPPGCQTTASPSSPSRPPVRAPLSFFTDCIAIAADEARHFGWLQQRLRHWGSCYGALPAHTGLWDVAASTSGDLLGRLVVLPGVHEARALDSLDRLAGKLTTARDLASAAVLRDIIDEETPHVAAGMRWYQWAAQAAGADPVTTFHASVKRYFTAPLPGPFNAAARAAAGLTPDFYLPVARPGAELR